MTAPNIQWTALWGTPEQVFQDSPRKQQTTGKNVHTRAPPCWSPRELRLEAACPMLGRNVQERGSACGETSAGPFRLMTSVSDLIYKGPPLSGPALWLDRNLSKDCSESRTVFSRISHRIVWSCDQHLWPDVWQATQGCDRHQGAPEGIQRD